VLDHAVPIVAVPTTYAGSEATEHWGITVDGRKTTGRDERTLPSTVIYLPDLTAALPRNLAVESGLNALAHAVDSLWAPGANPIDATLAEEGMRLLAMSLRTLTHDDASRQAHREMLIGTYLSSRAFSGTGSGLHHKICHVLGGTFNLPHAATHAVVLPYVVALNAPSAPDASRRIESALGARGAVGAVRDLATDLGAPARLSDLGFDHGDIELAAAIVSLAVPSRNPGRVNEEVLVRLLTAAWAGDAAA